MAPTNTYELVDRILDGNLAAMLGDWRTEGISYQQIAYRLRDNHSIEVSDETVRRWVRELEAA